MRKTSKKNFLENIKNEIQELYNSKVATIEKGKVKKVTIASLIAQMLVNNALKKDYKAMDLLFKINGDYAKNINVNKDVKIQSDTLDAIKEMYLSLKDK